MKTCVLSLERLVLAKLATLIYETNKPPFVAYLEERAAAKTCYLDISADLTPQPFQTIDSLPLTTLLKGKLKNTTIYMISELIKWKDENEILLSHNMSLLADSLCWTVKGDIDTKQTVVKFLVKSSSSADRKIDIKHEFSICCHYCFEDNVRSMRDQVQMIFQEPKPHSSFELISWYWIDLIKDRFLFTDIEDPGWSDVWFCSSLIVRKLPMENDLALEYFWQKLPSPIKLEILKTESCAYKIIRALCRLNIDTELLQDREILSKHAYSFLRDCLDNWLWNDNFFSLLDYLKEYFIDEGDYFGVFCDLLMKIKQFEAVDDLQAMFREFLFQNGRRVVDYINRDTTQLGFLIYFEFMLDLASLQDWVRYQMMFFILPPDKKKEFLSDHRTITVLFQKDKLDVLDGMAKQVFPTKEEMAKYKKKYFYSNYSLSLRMLAIGYDVHLFKKVIDWAALSKNEWKRYRNKIVKGKKYADVFLRLMTRDHWAIFLGYVNYFFPDPKKLEAFKKEFEDEKYVYFMIETLSWYENPDWEYIKEFKTWWLGEEEVFPALEMHPDREFTEVRI